MLIRNAALDGRLVDIRCAAGRISEIGEHLRPLVGEVDLDVAGAWVMPGLHDHHIHLRSLAATANSVRLGPPAAHDRDDLARLLDAAARSANDGAWLRGYGYHESVAGPLTREVLDHLVPDRPLRVQHRSGALWILNSAACRLTGVDGCDLPGVERDDAGQPTGRLWRMDAWLGGRVGSAAPDIASVSRDAAARGVTGFTDATPGLDQSSVDDLAGAVQSGDIMQRIHCMSTADIRPPADTGLPSKFTLGPTKILLDDDRLPGLDEFTHTIEKAHSAGKPVAVHCVTRVQLVLTMAALDGAGVLAGDRIEHGAIIGDDCFAWLRERQIPVVTQPNFPLERSEQYRTDVPDHDKPDLWRLGSLLAGGVLVAAGTDAPFGGADPWEAIRAAVIDHSDRDQAERVTPTVALGLFWGHADRLDVPRRVEPGALADLTIARGSLEDLRRDSSAIGIVATIVDGAPVYLG